jgi:hypothetical protein
MHTMLSGFFLTFSFLGLFLCTVPPISEELIIVDLIVIAGSIIVVVPSVIKFIIAVQRQRCLRMTGFRHGSTKHFPLRRRFALLNRSH